MGSVAGSPEAGSVNRNKERKGELTAGRPFCCGPGRSGGIAIQVIAAIEPSKVASPVVLHQEELIRKKLLSPDGMRSTMRNRPRRQAGQICNSTGEATPEPA